MQCYGLGLGGGGLGEQGINNWPSAGTTPAPAREFLTRLEERVAMKLGSGIYSVEPLPEPWRRQVEKLRGEISLAGLT